MDYEKLMQSSGFKNKEFCKRYKFTRKATKYDYTNCVRKIALDILFTGPELKEEVKRLFVTMRNNTGENDEQILLLLSKVFCLCRETIRDWTKEERHNLRGG